MRESNPSSEAILGRKKLPIREDRFLHISAFDPKKGAKKRLSALPVPLARALSLFQHVESSSEREPREMRGLPNQNDV